MKRLILTAPLALAACSSGSDITPTNWKCPALVEHVIQMSQSEEVKIIEITNVQERMNTPNYKLTCTGSAEWSRGYGNIEFGAHVSDGGKVMIEYNQK